MRGSPASASPMLPYWWALSLILSQLAAVSSERKTPLTPSTVPTRKTAWYGWPGAGRREGLAAVDADVERAVVEAVELLRVDPIGLDDRVGRDALGLRPGVA